MTEPPRRDPIACGTTWDYLGIRNFNLERWDAAAAAFAHAAETQPSPRVLVLWAMAETMRGDLPAAERLYGRALERDSTRAIAWQGYGVVSLRLGKLDQAHQRGRAAAAPRSGNPQAPERAARHRADAGRARRAAATAR